MLKPILIGVGYTVLPRPQRHVWVKKRFELGGPTYIKMGQFISSRGDIFDKQLSESLSVLKDSVEPVEWNDMKDGIDMTHFQSVDCAPLATASIAQVHRAVLTDGTPVAIKVKKPNVHKMIREDIDGLKKLCTFFPMFTPSLVEFEMSLIRELDFASEVNTLKRFYDMYEYSSSVRVPRVYPTLCTESMIVMEYLPSDGVPVHPVQLINAFIHQLLYEDVVHGDMHSGNIGFSEGKVILYDFGNVIQVSQSYRRAMRDFVYAIQTTNVPEIIDAMKRMGMKVVNMDATKAFLNKFLKYIETVDIQSFKVDPDEIQEMVPVQLDTTTFKLLRSYSLLEGYCKQIGTFNYRDIFMQNIELLYLDPDYIVYRGTKDLSRILART
jgi:predicted unusual protein kinase regulating ubiquinone biosynthesis (AarF/ABC1/UbiB family)